MEKLQDRGANRRFVLLASAAYLVSYLTRINFGTVIFEMVRDTGFDRAAPSTAITGAFITYGASDRVAMASGEKWGHLSRDRAPWATFMQKAMQVGQPHSLQFFFGESLKMSRPFNAMVISSFQP